MSEIKQPRHEEALSGVNARRACLFSEAEARRKEQAQEFAAQKKQAVTKEIREPEPVTAVDDFKIDNKTSARFQQELVMKEIFLMLFFVIELLESPLRFFSSFYLLIFDFE